MSTVSVNLSQSCTILTILKLSGSLSAFLWWDHYFRWAHLPVALVIIIFKLNILSIILTAIRDFSFEFFTCLFFRVIGQYTIRTELKYWFRTCKWVLDCLREKPKRQHCVNLFTDCVNQLSLIILFTQSMIITHPILEHSITRITFISVCFI